jgi:hypothetical protein
MWIKAIKPGFFATWPLLTTKAVKKHFPEHDKTPKGHMGRVKSGVRSTKAQMEESEEIRLAEAPQWFRGMSLCRFIKRYPFVVTYLVKVLCRYPIKSSDEHEKVATNRLTFINNKTSIEKHRRRNTTIANSNTIDRLYGIFGGLLNCISPQRFPENARLSPLPSDSIAIRYVHDPVSPSTITVATKPSSVRHLHPSLVVHAY